MTVYEIPNINHCTVIEIGAPVSGYEIRANTGWYIHTAKHKENVYTTIIIVPTSYNFSTIQIVAEEDLPEGAEIHGNVHEKE